MNAPKGLCARLCLIVCAAAPLAAGQVPPPPQPGTPPPAKQPVERLGPERYRVGTIHVDTAKRLVTVRGTVNQVTVLEFVANAKAGIKAYETAITLDTDAINFNVALVLIGLDKTHAKPSAQHFDPSPVSGDAVDLTLEWQHRGKTQRGPIERLLFDRETKQELPPGDWVYTGSTFTPDGRYLAELEGTLIGFAHTPSSVIESVKGVGLGRYGSIILNPSLGLMPGSEITLHIRALPAAPATRDRASRR